jgi:DNA-binding NarL/FixJ family response regulator
MADNSRTEEENDEILETVIQRISADKITAHNWNTQSVVLLYVSLVAIIVLELEEVSMIIIATVAVLALLAFLALNHVHKKKLEQRVTEKRTDIYRKHLERKTEEPVPIPTSLSPKELQILQMVAEGNINKQIAIKLGLSTATVRNHVSRMMQKLDASDRTEAVVIAISNGWISVKRHSNPFG